MSECVMAFFLLCCSVIFHHVDVDDAVWPARARFYRLCFYVDCLSQNHTPKCATTAFHSTYLLYIDDNDVVYSRVLSQTKKNAKKIILSAGGCFVWNSIAGREDERWPWKWLDSFFPYNTILTLSEAPINQNTRTPILLSMCVCVSLFDEIKSKGIVWHVNIVWLAYGQWFVCTHIITIRIATQS